jgi:peptidoglycan/LPS O-acetylase OafA/YrhL
MAHSPNPAASPGRFDELEAYRGIAALLIVIFHAYQFSRAALNAAPVYAGTAAHVVLSNLEASVSWFFVLSGFLIFLPFARAALARRSPQSARGFLIRRAIRILPPYYLAILVVWALRYSGGPGQWLDLFQHLTFTQIFDQEHFFWTIGPAWSLAVEVWFYLFLAVAGPLLYVACGRIAGPGGRVALLAGVAGALVLASVLYKWWALEVAGIPLDAWPVYFGPLARGDTLAMGMLLAVVVAATNGRALIGGAAALWLRVVGVALLVAAAALREQLQLAELFFYTVAGASFLLVLASTVVGPRGSRWERSLSWGPLQFLGLVSYSLYLWHEPILIGLGQQNLIIQQAPAAFPWNALALSTLAIGAGALSYYGVERPTMELRHLFTREGRLAPRYPEERGR